MQHTNYPNILYIHSHDTGRYVQPYGYAIPTPRIQRLAEEGMLFRKAFCAAPTCSGSRASLLTGQHAHSNGMLGLAHRGFSLRNYRHHIVHTLRKVGYYSVLIGEQHISKEPDIIGYDKVFKIDTSHVDTVAPLAIETILTSSDNPFSSRLASLRRTASTLNPVHRKMPITPCRLPIFLILLRRDAIWQHLKPVPAN